MDKNTMVGMAIGKLFEQYYKERIPKDDESLFVLFSAVKVVSDNVRSAFYAKRRAMLANKCEYNTFYRDIERTSYNLKKKILYDIKYEIIDWICEIKEITLSAFYKIWLVHMNEIGCANKTEFKEKIAIEASYLQGVVENIEIDLFCMYK